MPVSKNRKNHKAKAAKRRKEHELKRHNTQKFAQQLQGLIEQYKQEELNKEMLTITGTDPNGTKILPSTEIF